MNSASILNGVPLVAFKADGELGFVSPALRALCPTIENRILAEVLPRYRLGEGSIAISVEMDTGRSDYLCRGYADVDGGVTFVVQRSVDEVREKSSHLETLGEIAAGVAHEINTPLQYITDNTQFVADSIQKLLGLIGNSSQVTSVQTEDDRLEVEFLSQELPRALSQSMEGLVQVSEIVHALKEFSHPSKDKVPTQVNNIVRRALTLTRNEWKYCATVESKLETTLPEIPVVAGELCQSLVNLIVNASHALTEVHKDSGSLGVLTITTERHARSIRISISDNGCGITEENKARIFQPFFTTKVAGKGTGQGLAQVRNCVETLHGGVVSFTSTEGVGTTFHIDLPISA